MARKPAVRLANVIDSIRTAKKIERDIEDKGGNRDNTEEEKAGTDMYVSNPIGYITPMQYLTASSRARCLQAR